MIASKMLLLQDPFGPEIDTSPGSKFTVVFLNPNDLNPNGWETHFVIGQQF